MCHPLRGIRAYFFEPLFQGSPGTHVKDGVMGFLWELACCWCDCGVGFRVTESDTACLSVWLRHPCLCTLFEGLSPLFWGTVARVVHEPGVFRWGGGGGARAGREGEKDGQR